MRSQQEYYLDSKDRDALVQAYAGARWGRSANSLEAARIGQSLERSLRDRIDALGIDGQRLLKVHPADVMAELVTLETEALLEDSSARMKAARLRTGEDGFRDDRDRGGREGNRGTPGYWGHRHRRQR